NEDGKISLKEAKGPLKTDFKIIDTNEDGFISKKEMKKAPKPERPEKKENKK
ncbi:MAG: Ca2+-binding EF-hand superfamily protein, partial [Paraglaciecola sp.]